MPTSSVDDEEQRVMLNEDEYYSAMRAKEDEWIEMFLNLTEEEQDIEIEAQRKILKTLYPSCNFPEHPEPNYEFEYVPDAYIMRTLPKYPPYYLTKKPKRLDVPIMQPDTTR